MRRETRRESPRWHGPPDFADLSSLIQVHEIDRKLHKEGMDRFAGNDPQAVSRFQFGVLQQPGPPLRTGICHLRAVCEHSPASVVPHQNFQVRKTITRLATAMLRSMVWRTGPETGDLAFPLSTAGRVLGSRGGPRRASTPHGEEGRRRRQEWSGSAKARLLCTLRVMVVR